MVNSFSTQLTTIYVPIIFTVASADELLRWLRHRYTGKSLILLKFPAQQVYTWYWALIYNFYHLVRGNFEGRRKNLLGQVISSVCIKEGHDESKTDSRHQLDIESQGVPDHSQPAASHEVVNLGYKRCLIGWSQLLFFLQQVRFWK